MNGAYPRNDRRFVCARRNSGRRTGTRALSPDHGAVTNSPHERSIFTRETKIVLNRILGPVGDFIVEDFLVAAKSRLAFDAYRRLGCQFARAFAFQRTRLRPH